jgi:hypothetical protein
MPKTVHDGADSDSDSGLPLYRHERIIEAIRWNTVRRCWTRGTDGPPVVVNKRVTLFPRTITHIARKPATETESSFWEPIQPIVETFRQEVGVVYHPEGYSFPWNGDEEPSFPPPGESTTKRPFKPSSLCNPDTANLRYCYGPKRGQVKQPKVVDPQW